mgnify:CR=1 FL=1
MMQTATRVLKIDISGVPQMWIGVEDAARYYATDSVAYTLGEHCVHLRGGHSRLTGATAICAPIAGTSFPIPVLSANTSCRSAVAVPITG